MTRQLFILTVSLALTALTSCVDSHKETDSSSTVTSTQTIPTLQLPLKIRCDNFPRVLDSIGFSNAAYKHLAQDTSTYFGKIIKGDLTVLIKNKNKIQSPILHTVDKNGQTVDSLVLFDRLCYVGVDSDYLPWIEITNDLTVIRTDTSYYSRQIKNTDNPKTKEIYEIAITTDTTINIDRFKIDNFGKISKTK